MVLMSKGLMLVIVLQLVGVITIIAEFVLPSGGLLTVAAFGLFGYSLFHVFYNVSPTAGIIFVALDCILIPVLVIVGIKMLAKSPMALKKSLSQKSGVSSQDAGLQNLIGKTGKLITDCRPAGKAVIEGKRFDVVSGGDYIGKESAVIVSEVNSNRIIIKKTG